jgi:diguanylate cyclase (GGDEF)-like protein
MSDEPSTHDPAASIEAAMSADEHLPTRAAVSAVAGGADVQALAELDQSIADGDQTAADLDQSAADVDETASERDQLAADRDQVAADDDRAAALDHGQEPEDGNAYARSRRARSKSTRDREAASRVRTGSALARDTAATRRDRMAAERDTAARLRDELAAKLDAELERLELEDSSVAGASNPESGLRRVRDRRRAGTGRARAAIQRDAAAHDRESAAEDRRQAARDRDIAAGELAAEGIDDLTGAMLRRVGLGAIQRELDRTRRSGEDLVVAYVDVDGLKAVNDTAGHMAGDALLTNVAESITHELRSYDVICRFGGDEFVCSLTGQDADGARERFQQIGTRLFNVASGATITVGFAERTEDDTLEGLIGRADATLTETRQRRQA